MNKRTEYILLALILALAAVMRLGWPGITEFKRDEALLSQMALDMARGESFPLHGITSSVGLPNPPVSVYLFAIPYALSSDPTLATLYVGLLNVAAVALAWWLARRYFGAWPALAAALLYAAAPWGVIYSRKIWAQNLLPPFVLLVIITGLLGFAEEKPRWKFQVAHLVLLVIAVQIHMAAAALAPLTLVLLWIGRRRVDRRFWVAGVGLAALTLAPFALAAARGDWLSSAGNAFDAGGGSMRVTLEALQHTHRVIGGYGIHALTSADAFREYLGSTPDLWPLLELVGTLALASAAWLIFDGLRRREHARLLLGLWVLVPALAFTVEWTQSYPHYFIAVIPAGCIALVVAAKDVAGALARRWVYAALAAAVMFVSFSGAYLTLELLAFLDTHDVTDAFGTPLGDLLAVRDAAEAAAGQREILVFSDGEDPEIDEAAAVWRFLLYDHAGGARMVNATQQFVYPPSGAAAIAKTDLWNAMHLDDDPLFSSDSQYHVALWDDTPTPAGVAIDRRLANGMTLRWWDAESAQLAWEAGGPADRRYSLFVHLLDASGARIAQADSNAWIGPWREGDVIVTRMNLVGESVTAPPGGTWRFGMYFFNADGSTTGVDVLDAAGGPAGWWVDVPVE